MGTIKTFKEYTQNLYSENKFITNLFILSFVINILYGATNHLPELFTNADFWFDFVRQIGLAIIASYIFYVFIEYIPSKKNNKKYTKIVFEQLKTPINMHLRLFIYMYKSSVKKKPEILPHSINELFSEDFFVSLYNLNVNAQAPVIEEQTWASYIHQECIQFSNNVNDVLMKYSHFLSGDLIKLLEDIRKTIFMQVVLYKGMLRVNVDGVWIHKDSNFGEWISNDETSQSKNYIFRTTVEDGKKHLLKDHIILLLKLIERFNNYIEESDISLDVKLWSDTIAPTYGDSN